ncbi:MAG: DUF885 domain-containing protein, partial [Eubacteriales bacterium]|nr:DUF885 domain-containing protein [Eubacteriales bacterium]
MIKKRLPLLAAPLAVLAALLFLSLTRSSFRDFTMEIFCRELSGNTLNLHYTLTDPSAWGIRETSVSFGDFSREGLEEELLYLEDCRERLSEYEEKGLSDEDQITAELLDWWLSGQLLMEDFYLYQEPLGPTLGIHAQLPVLLAEFPFQDAEDVEIYLALLSRLPDYFRQIADFEREKSDQGLFMADEILDQVLAQCRSLLTVDSSHFLVSSFRERLAGCDFLTENQKTNFEIENREALNTCFVPAYEALCGALEELRGAGAGARGLYQVPGGLAYFEYLLRYSVGTDLNIAQISRLLEDRMADEYETVLHAVEQGVELLGTGTESGQADGSGSAQAGNPQADSGNSGSAQAGGSQTDAGQTAGGAQAGADSSQEPGSAGQTADSSSQPAYILLRLQEQIREDFPAARDTSFTVKEVPESLSPYLSPAFYLTPPIDEERQNTIYINPSAGTDETTLITTLAHEGYPGHLYQNSFENQGSYDPVRNLFYVGGYTEGWGLYSEMYAYNLLGVSSLKADAMRALSSLNYALCASLDLYVHGQGWSEEQCAAYLKSFGITDTEQIHQLYLQIIETPSNYLKYYLGYLEIDRLKESALALSPDMTLLDFHQWFLETGPAPFYLLREHLDGSSSARAIRKAALTRFPPLR